MLYPLTIMVTVRVTVTGHGHDHSECDLLSTWHTGSSVRLAFPIPNIWSLPPPMYQHISNTFLTRSKLVKLIEKKFQPFGRPAASRPLTFPEKQHCKTTLKNNIAKQHRKTTLQSNISKQHGKTTLHNNVEK